ncbi:DNA polymerase, partial [Lophiostoma macrostomum CBS 122681]
KNVAKLILNSLIGRFGKDFYKSVTKLLNKEKHDYITTTRVVKDTKMLDNNLYLDCFIPSINKQICDKFGVYFTKALNYENYDDVKDVKSYKNVSITTAAAVLSYARIHMSKIFFYIFNNGGTIYYHDTDSVATNLKLPEDLVDKNKLGKLKLEYIIEEGFFIKDKTYYIKTIEGKVIKKSNSVNS